MAIGITVDSYVVYFERLKDEVRAGRTIRQSVDRSFARAFRTVVTADTVAFMAAAILYLLTVGDVKGFAFMLGLSTLLDIVFAYFFIRPAVILAGRNPRLLEARFIGLSRGLGARTSDERDVDGSPPAQRLPTAVPGRDLLRLRRPVAPSGSPSRRVIISIGLISLSTRGLNFSIDFKGGTVWEVPSTASVAKARDVVGSRRAGLRAGHHRHPHQHPDRSAHGEGGGAGQAHRRHQPGRGGHRRPGQDGRRLAQRRAAQRHRPVVGLGHHR